MGTTVRSGRRCSTCAWRRSDEVPTTAPCGSSASVAALLLMKASRTSSRGRIAGDRQARRQQRRHVLHGMHGEVDLAGQQRLLDLLGEEALAAGLGERAVLDAVARGLDGAHLERPCVPARARPPGARAPRAPAPAPAASRACRCGSCDACKGRSSDARRCRTPRRPVYAPVRALVQTTPHGHATATDTRETLVLGIETSCDETAAAVVARAADGARAHPVQRRAGAVGAAPPLRRRGAGDRRARARRVPRRDRRRGFARGGRRPGPSSTPWR